jgi:EmrB/QacA subfamily drug resistance transporter
LERRNLSPAVTTSGADSKTIVLVVSSLSNLVTTFMMSGVNVALPAINQEFHSDAIVLGWVVTSFVLAVSVFCVPFGRIADLAGIKRIFVYGMVLFTLTSIATIFSNSVQILIGLRALQGVSSAMTASTSVALITAVYPAKERGRALGISIASVYAGLSIGPFFGGLLIAYFNWRSIFLVISPLSFLLFLLLIWKVKGEWCESRGEKFDYQGSAIYGFSLVALMYGFSLLPELLGAVITVVGILGILAFVKWESRTASPILNVSMFKSNRTFAFSNLAALFNYSSTSAIIFFLSLYLQYLKGFSPQHAGLILLAQPVIQTIMAPFSGRLSDRIEPRIMASAGMALTCLGLISFCFLTPTTPIWQIVVTLLVLGGGFGLFVSPNTNAIMGSVTPRFYATASSVTSTTRTVGQTLSMGIAMIIIALIVGRKEITPGTYLAFLSSARICFVIFAVLCFAGIFASMARNNSNTRSNQGSASGNTG